MLQTEELPETGRVSWQKEIWKISASLGFIKKKTEEHFLH